MPVQFSLQEVIDKNSRALSACESSATRLRSIAGLPAHIEVDRIDELSRASNESTHLRQLDAHLRAALTVVQPIDDQMADELNELDNALDEKIRRNEITSATIDFISNVLTDATRVGNIIRQHT